MAREAGVQGVDRGRGIVEPGELPAPRPSIDLALDESGRSAEITELTRRRIEPLELGHGVDEREADPAANIGMTAHAGWDRRAHHLAPAALHHEEVGAEHGGVVAEDVRPRCPVEPSPEPGENLVLAPHVV